MAIETKTGGIECYEGQSWVIDQLASYGSGELQTLPYYFDRELDLLTGDDSISDDVFILGRAYTEEGQEILDPLNGAMTRGYIVEDHLDPTAIWVTAKRNLNGR